jgi:hypothetical protein
MQSKEKGLWFKERVWGMWKIGRLGDEMYDTEILAGGQYPPYYELVSRCSPCGLNH